MVCCDWLVLVVLFGGWCLGSVASAIVWCVGFVFYYLILLVWVWRCGDLGMVTRCMFGWFGFVASLLWRCGLANG